MIRESRGNLLKANADAIVNAVNCVGVMGKGIALQFKQAYPHNYRAYKDACDIGQVRIGHMFVYDTRCPGPRRYIVNFPTKEHWRSQSSLEGVAQGLFDLVGVVKQRGIKSIAIPALGCGNGGLEWTDVKPLIEQAFADTPDTTVILYPPQRTATPSMNHGRVCVAMLIAAHHTRTGAYQPTPNAHLAEVHALTYLLHATGCGIPLNDFAESAWGVHSPGLTASLRSMEGSLIRWVGPLTPNPRDPEPGAPSSSEHATPVRIELLPGVTDAARTWINRHPQHDVDHAVTRVTNLVEDRCGPELDYFAAAHWAATRHLAAEPTRDRVVEHVQSWLGAHPERPPGIVRTRTDAALTRLHAHEFLRLHD